MGSSSTKARFGAKQVNMKKYMYFKLNTLALYMNLDKKWFTRVCEPKIVGQVRHLKNPAGLVGVRLIFRPDDHPNQPAPSQCAPPRNNALRRAC